MRILVSANIISPNTIVFCSGPTVKGDSQEVLCRIDRGFCRRLPDVPEAPPTNGPAALAGAPRHLRRAFHKFKNQRWHANLDNCHGKCLLRERRFANIVTESLLTLDSQRYDVERFVIMPNHVKLHIRGDWASTGRRRVRRDTAGAPRPTPVLFAQGHAPEWGAECLASLTSDIASSLIMRCAEGARIPTATVARNFRAWTDDGQCKDSLSVYPAVCPCGRLSAGTSGQIIRITWPK